ncbi:MAG: glycosyl hydrolase [Muribaculaceae bacterium]|nr:glycosyl hydrolase [Muribaculaceae bacterium]
MTISLNAGNWTSNSFAEPSAEFGPGVYWYFMDGNMSKEGITKDLESMKKAGIKYAIFLEVNVGVPRGKIDFMSDEWLDYFKYIIQESKRVGIKIILGIGPGWAGSGGPWVKGGESMLHLVASSVTVNGTGSKQTIKLQVPEPKNPYFGTGNFSPAMKEEWERFYKDVAVIAFPTPKHSQLIKDADEKSLYYRPPYSSTPGVKQYLPTMEAYKQNTDSQAVVDGNRIIDLSTLLRTDGTIEWTVPEGEWTIMRFGCRNNGAVTRPAPLPGVGMECDKLDTTSASHHLNHYTDRLFQTLGDTPLHTDKGGLTMLHIDSWEMGAQNWTPRFREEFKKRRGYEPQPYYPAYLGLIVKNREVSERFLWDVRETVQELLLENHAGYVKSYAHRHGLTLSIEPYDMNPTADLELGAMADVPMCEFWSKGYGYDTEFSAIEATSDAHLLGQNVVPAESFTAYQDGWKQYPGVMKNQTDWALATGLNRLMFHTFQHQCLDDSLKPGMTMGPYGVHWDRNQTWWPMVTGYHKYITRCQYMLQQGHAVADILYLNPEGAPHVFRAPKSALDYSDSIMPDHKGYSFDGCPPSMLYEATVENGKIVFPSGASYRLLVLPDNKTITPKLLGKIYGLISKGATVIGNPYEQSPSLNNYPQCDNEVKNLVMKIWGNDSTKAIRMVGKGRIIRSGSVSDNLYQPYPQTAAILSSMNIAEDFHSDKDCIRHTHRQMRDCDIYFVSNRTKAGVETKCTFRVKGNAYPELWNPMNGAKRALPDFSRNASGIEIPLKFESNESYFIIFAQGGKTLKPNNKHNFERYVPIDTLTKAWQVEFKTKGNGTESVIFDKLTEWNENDKPEIKYYSGIATYEQTFNESGINQHSSYYIDLNKVNVMAHVWLNGKDLGIIWTSPFMADATGALKNGENKLKIEVANLWPNRLIGDAQLPNDGIVNGQWPEWILKGKNRPSNRVTFTTCDQYKKTDTLLESGLTGPVCIVKAKNE